MAGRTLDQERDSETRLLRDAVEALVLGVPAAVWAGYALLAAVAIFAILDLAL